MKAAIRTMYVSWYILRVSNIAMLVEDADSGYERYNSEPMLPQ